MQRLTKEQSAIIGAYTGFCAGNFGGIQEYAERVLGRSIWTHEFSTKELSQELRKAAQPDFISICYDGD